MIGIKCVILLLIIMTSSIIGNLYSQKFVKRVKELQEIKSALNMFRTKIKYTYEPIPDIFQEIGTKFSCNVSNIFIKASEQMNELSAGEAWKSSIDIVYSNLTKEDKDVLKSLGKMLGKTDIDGQINEIRLTDKFLEVQIKEAQSEKEKNEKLYRTLGATVGLALVIVLI